MLNSSVIDTHPLETDMRGLKVIAAGLLAVGVLITGCANRQAGNYSQANDAYGDAPSRRAMDAGAMQIDHDAVTVSKKMPALVGVNEEFSYDLSVKARDTVGQVTLSEELPAGSRFIKSEPEARLVGNQMVWVIHAMQRGETRTYRITLKAEQVGRLSGETQVNIQRQASAATIVGRPALRIDESGPAVARLGGDLSYDIRVTNTGTAVARDIEVTALVPEGLSHTSGSKQLAFTVGNLDPGQSKNLALPLRTVNRGQFRSESRATSSNAGTASADAVTTVVLQSMEIVNKGFDDQYVGKTAPYEIVVRNTGDVALKDVVVTDNAALETGILSAEGAKLSGKSASWVLPELPPGSERRFSIVLGSDTPGTHKNLATVKSAEGITGESAYATLWKGLPGLLLNTADTVDPIRQGETTDFIITLTNQGSAADSNINVAMSFPAGLVPIVVVGASSGAISGQIVSFAPYATLSPKQSISWSVKARGVAVGDNRTRVQFTSDSIKVPVVKDESTQVY
jgi:uncharacterized repeat protein (TIGR01451 family)